MYRTGPRSFPDDEVRSTDAMVRCGYDLDPAIGNDTHPFGGDGQELNARSKLMDRVEYII